MSDQESINLIERWRAGDERAAETIFERYVDRLVALARGRLSAKLKRRVDPEDIVQSAYRSFFRRAQDDQYSFQHSGDLWRLLAAITVNKLLMQARFHHAGKRALDHEASLASSGMMPNVTPEALAREPMPDEAAALVEELELMMRPLRPQARQVLELKLQGAGVEEIALQIGRTERTVRRVLEQVRDVLASRLAESSSSATGARAQLL